AAVRAGTRTGEFEPSGPDRWSDLYGRLREYAAADQEAALADERRS
ncbi:MAG: hypothetical protein IRY90_16045, partial [Actinomadura rubrobrunea]|nr:hypothetical protein [Actinomadura rubrobrunea]